jgi:hypothetical protein
MANRLKVGQVVFVGLVAFFMCVPIGCESAPTRRRATQIPNPEPVPAPAVPAGAQANRMTLLVSPNTEDSNGNGFPDVVHVTSSLFSHPYPTPIQADGTFVFELYAVGDGQQANDEPLAVWRRGPKQSENVKTMAIYGTCYPFALSLLEVFQSDRVPQIPLTIMGYYEPADGSEIVRCSQELRSVQLGRGGS